MDASSKLTPENILKSFQTDKEECYRLIEDAFNQDKCEVIYDALTNCQSVEEFEKLCEQISLIASRVYFNNGIKEKTATLFAIPFVGNINNLPEIDGEEIQETLEELNFLQGYEQCIILKKWVDLEQIGNMAPHQWNNIIHDFLQGKHLFPFTETEHLDPENPSIAGSLIIGILISDKENSLNIFEYGDAQENQIDFIEEANLWFEEMHIASVPSLMNDAIKNIINMQTVMTVKGFIDENLDDNIPQFIRLHTTAHDNNIYISITDKKNDIIDSIVIPVHFSSDWIKNTIELIVEESLENRIEFITHDNFESFPNEDNIDV